MGREIKFRYWDKEVKKIVDIISIGGKSWEQKKGWYRNCCVEYITDEWGGHIEVINGKEVKDYVVKQYYLDIPLDGFDEYTGLKDKNGKEIYEGDIVGAGKNIAGHIIPMYSNNDFPTGGFTIKYKRMQYPTPMEVSKFYEILGNIYENSELLKKE